jgi:FKBP-type peptidyl-prolyl cis-trans isomerase (trigger factor)
MKHSLTDIKITRDDTQWETEIKAVIPAETLAQYRTEALKEIAKTAKVDGFRPGHAPENRIVEIYGEPAIMRAAAEHAIQGELPLLLAAENVMVIEAPKVTTDTPEAGKPLSFTARAALAPSVTLPDYKKIKAKHATSEPVAVTDEEHAQTLTHLKRERARISKVEAGTDAAQASEEARAIPEADLPELDEAFVQSLGYPDIAAFSEAVRKNMQTEKEMQAAEKRRAAILEDLLKDAKVSYPVSLKNYELDEMEARLSDDIARTGATLEQYLVEAKKTREELRTDWQEAADKRAKVRLILAEISRAESIEPPAEAIVHELEHATKMYPKADPDALRAHIAHAMRNEAVLRYLDGTEDSLGTER